MFFSQDDILSLLSNEVEQYDNSIILIKNNTNISLKMIESYIDGCRDGKDNKSDIKCLYYTYTKENFYIQYNPIIRFIEKEYTVLTKNELDSNVYPPYVEVFNSYFKTGRAKRNEDIIPFDYKFESEKMKESLLNVLNVLNKNKKVYILLENVNYMSYSTLKWLIWLIKNEHDYNFKVIGTLSSDDYYDKKMQDDFEVFLDMIESKHSLLEINTNDYIENTQNEEINENYSEYLINGENSFQFLCLEEALYYFINYYNKNTDNNNVYTVLSRIGDIYLFKEDNRNANYYYDLLLKKSIKNYNESWKAKAYQKLSMLEIIKLQYAEAEKYAKNSLKIAKSINDDYLKFKSYELLFWINEKGKYRTTIENIGYEEEYIYLAKKYRQNNRLAYFLTHNYNVISFIGPSDQSAEYYNEGHKLAIRIKNENCILSAHLKTALVYAVNGLYEKSQEYYKKIVNILIDMNDEFRLAQTYNGMGYYLLNLGKYESANEHYNKALQKLKSNWNFDEICMTLINASINSMMAFDYVTADKQMEILILVIKQLKLSRLRLISLAKIYGIMALDNIYLGNSYKSYTLLAKMQTMTHKNRVFYEDDEEYFLINFTKGLILKKKKIYYEAISFFKAAHENIYRIKGSLKCFYPKFLFEYYMLMLESNKEDEAEKIKDIGLEYCRDNNIESYIEIFETQKINSKSFEDNLLQCTWIVEAAKQQSTITLLNKKIEEINFINSFQEILTNIDDKENVINKSMLLLENVFDIDYSYIAGCDESKDELIYFSGGKKLSQYEVKKLKDILEEYKEPFVSTKESALKRILEKNTNSKISSYLYIPIIKENQHILSFVFMTKFYIGPVNNKVILDDSKLRIINIAIRQLSETIQRIKWQDKLIESVSTDMLTKLYNRQYFYNKLSEIVQKANENKKIEKICLLYIDLDNFKYYNDNFGHEVGDMILVWFSDILKKVSENRGIPVRYGGDEFLLLLENSDYEQGKEIAHLIYYNLKINNNFKEKICGFINKDVTIPDNNLINCSIGIEYDTLTNKLNMKKFIDNADKSLYKAKKLGKGKMISLTHEYL